MILHPCPECSGEIKIYVRTGVGAVAVCQKCKAESVICGVDELHVYDGCKIKKSTVEKVKRLWNERHLHRLPDIMASINPEWVEPIIDGIKKYEVRKTAPKTKVPFKVYVYCTKSGKIYFRRPDGVAYTTPYNRNELIAVHPDAEILNGKVVAEFICDKVIEVPRLAIWHAYIPTTEIRDAIAESCVSMDELIRYCGDKPALYFWHIADLVVYNIPKRLSDFRIPDYKMELFGSWVWKQGKTLERAPQSYQFVIANEEAC